MGLKNPRITPKERGLLKGAIRRVFSRSELRRAAIEAVRIEHVDPTRPRVKKWSLCPVCKTPTPTYLMQVDHLSPIVPIHTTLEDMSMDVLVDNTWCELIGLEAKCKPCHAVKTKDEASARRKHRKERKSNE